MRVYFIAMAVRILCVASLFFVRGWWILLVGVAVVVLPYFAVMVANQHAPEQGTAPDAPTPPELTAADAPQHGEDEARNRLLIVDAPADRRSSSAGDENGREE